MKGAVSSALNSFTEPEVQLLSRLLGKLNHHIAAQS